MFDPPTELEDALDDLESLLGSPSLTMLGEGPTRRAHLRRMLRDGDARGHLVHDAHIPALAIEHGVAELLAADRDLARCPALRCRDPFAPGG